MPLAEDAPGWSNMWHYRKRKFYPCYYCIKDHEKKGITGAKTNPKAHTLKGYPACEDCYSKIKGKICVCNHAEYRHFYSDTSCGQCHCRKYQKNNDGVKNKW